MVCLVGAFVVPFARALNGADVVRVWEIAHARGASSFDRTPASPEMRRQLFVIQSCTLSPSTSISRGAPAPSGAGPTSIWIARHSLSIVVACSFAIRSARSLPAMRTPRHGLGGVSKGRRIYAIEGGDEPGFHFTRAIEYLDLPR